MIRSKLYRGNVIKQEKEREREETERERERLWDKKRKERDCGIKEKKREIVG